MILVKPSAEILCITNRPLQLIERAGRTCYKSEDKIIVTSAGNFVEMILKRGHDSVLEHASATVRFICDRGVSHELVRHRLASYSQESTRYCNYKGGVAFIIPPWVVIEPGEYAGTKSKVPISAYTDERLGSKCDNILWAKTLMEAELSYLALLHIGWKPEQARSVLPNSLKTEIVMTANFREWRHFFKLRTAPATHPQMREITIPLLLEFQKRIPIIFDDI
jgi:thymidylate synthase (FAD)